MGIALQFNPERGEWLETAAQAWDEAQIELVQTA